jgi:hypothetical protein
LGPHRLTARSTPVFVGLVERHGCPWAQRLFSAWTDIGRYGAPPWLARLAPLCEALSEGGEHGAALAAWLVDREVASFRQKHADALPRLPAFREKPYPYLDDLLALLKAAVAVAATRVRDDLLSFLTAPKTTLPLMAAGELLTKARRSRTPAATRALGLQPLYRHVVAALERALAAPGRRSDDWSIEARLGCSCGLCATLAAFLRDRERFEHRWPLPKERRRHVHDAIDRHSLPVSHATLRRGSPQTLVLTKQKTLFAHDAAARVQQKKLLVWLEKQRSAFSDAPHPTGASRGRTSRDRRVGIVS